MKAHFRTDQAQTRYLIAVVGSIFAFLGQYVVSSWTGPLPFLLVYPACFAVMALAGFGPACVAIFLSAAGAELIYGKFGMEPAWSFHAKIFGFCLMSLVVAWILDRNQKADSQVAARLAEFEAESERLEIEARLQVSESRYQSLFELVPIGLVQSEDGDPNFKVANTHFCAMTGYSAQELTSMNFHDLLVEEDRLVDTGALSDLYAGKSSIYDREKRLVRKDRAIIWARVVLRAVRRSNGIPLHIVGVIQEITDRKRAEEERETSRRELVASRGRIRDYIEAMPTMAFIADANGKITYYNQRWLEYAGHEIEQRNWAKIVHPSHLQKTVETWNHSIDTGSPFEIEYLMRRNDGAYRWILGRATSVRNERGEIVEWYGTNTDIHELKAVQDELRVAKDRAEQANSLKSTFLANMSHEIRTPMTAVLGFSEILRDPELPDTDRQDALARIDRSGRALLRLIDDILDISKIEAGKLAVERLRFSPVEILDEVISMLRLQADQKGIRLVVNIDASVPNIAWSDPARVRQILTNIIGNAVKFTSHGAVAVAVRAEPNETLAFVVTDSGIGISPDDQLKLFRPFAQADESITRQFGGTGLGLVLSKRLCQQLGGDLVLEESRVGEGSRFAARLKAGPFESATASAQANGSKARASTREPVPHFAGRSVLLVEDVIDNQVLMQRHLAPTKLQIEIANNGREALAKASERTFDLILMDIQMPVMDGIEAVKRLRENNYQGPVLALTAHAMSEEVTRSLEAGFDDHLTKPISKDKLFTALATYLAVPKVDADSVTQPAPLVSASSFDLSGKDLEAHSVRTLATDRSSISDRET